MSWIRNTDFYRTTVPKAVESFLFIRREPRSRDNAGRGGEGWAAPRDLRNVRHLPRPARLSRPLHQEPHRLRYHQVGTTEKGEGQFFV